jgi:hypothetical protein
MKNGALFLLIILLLSLVLCSVLGGKNCLKEGFGSGEVANQIAAKTGVTTTSTDSSTSDQDTSSEETTSSSSNGSYNTYDNYNHNTGTSYPTTFYGPNGGTANIRNKNGNYSILITNSNGSTTLYTNANNNGSNYSTTTSSSSSQPVTKKVFNGPNGGSARVFMGSDGQYVVEITDSNGSKTAYSSSVPTSTYSNTNTNTYNSSNDSAITQKTYYGPNGVSARVINNGSQFVIEITDQNGVKTVYSSNSNTTYSSGSGSGSGSGSITGTVYYGPNGGSARVVKDSSTGQFIIEVTDSYGNNVVYNSSNNTAYTNSTTTSENNAITQTIYYGPNGGSARVVSNGSQFIIEITDQNGVKTVYSSNSNTTYSSGSGSGSASITNTIYYGPNGSSAHVVKNNSTGQYIIEVTDSYGNKLVYSSTGNNAYTNTANMEPYYYNGYNYNYYSEPTTTASAGSVTGPNGNTAAYATGPYGNNVAGVSGSAIPPGDEDLYILKSQVVPPVCPACPAAASCPRQEPCPACPACARCPEPAFECKKVPNYNNINDNYLPMPILSDFSTFGM